jgi:hypothetical protein
MNEQVSKLPSPTIGTMHDCSLRFCLAHSARVISFYINFAG